MSTSFHHGRVEELLAQTGWVRAIAARLVQDPGLADDVAQDAMIAAVQKPPEDPTAIRAWLAAVVRNLARQRRRGEARRRRREAEVGSSNQEYPSAAELAARVETQQELATAVLELREPSRSTIILRFYEGLSSAEIARRGEIPAATVRGRLRRGLCELRTLLDRRSNGDRSAWMAALLPIVRTQGHRVNGAASSLALGALAMSMTHKIAIGGALAAVLCAGLLSIGPFQVGQFDATGKVSGDGPADSAAFVPPSSRDGGQLGATLDSAADRLTNATDRDHVRRVEKLSREETRSSQSGSVVARILGPQGNPASGARLLVPETDPSLQAQAQISGSVALDLPPSVCGTTVEVLVAAPGLCTKSLTVSPSCGETIDLGLVRLEAGGRVEGRVVDQNGELVQGAVVSAHAVSENEVSTLERARLIGPLSPASPVRVVATDGRFAMEGLGIRRVRLWADIRGHHFGWSQPVLVRANATTSDVVIRVHQLGNTDAVRGRVLYPGDIPAPDVSIHYVATSGSDRIRSWVASEETGDFEIRVKPDAVVDLRADPPAGWVAAPQTNIRPSAQIHLFRLQRSSTANIQVRTLDSAKLLAVSVRVLSANSTTTLFAATQAVSDEAAVQVPIPEEAYLVHLQHAGYRPVTLGPFDAGQPPRSLEVQFERLQVVSGRVLASGLPVSGATVRLHRRAAPNEHAVHNGFDVWIDLAPAPATKSDTSGRFSLGVQHSGAYILRVDALGFAPAEIQKLVVDAERGREGIEVSLGQGGSLEGTIRTNSGDSLGGVIVGLSRGDGYAKTLRASSDGTYRFERLLPGQYEVRLVEKEISTRTSESVSTFLVGGRQRSWSWNALIRAGETTVHDIAAPKDVHQSALSVSLHVDGVPAAGWTWQLSKEAAGGKPNTGALSLEGTARIESDQSGRCTLALSASRDRWIVMPVAREDTLSKLDLDLATGQLTGQISGTAAQSQDDVFYVTRPQVGVTTVTRLDVSADGNFHLEHAFAGRGHVVQIAHGQLSMGEAPEPANWRVLKTVDVPEGGETFVGVR